MVPVWPYGCPCGYVAASGAPSTSPPPVTYPGHAPGSYGPYPPPGYGPVQYNVQYTVVSAKSGGVAVLLTFLWLGAGHLYLGRTTPGVLLLVLHFFLIFLLVIPILGWVLGFLGWVAAFIGASVSCSSIATEENARMQHWGRGW